MELTIKNGQSIRIREYTVDDFLDIHRLNIEEKWTNLVEKETDYKQAWNNSNIAFVVLSEGKLIGYLRGITDKFITVYICELLISKGYRGFGIGQELLKYTHSMYPKLRIEMLSTSNSRTFYEQLGYRTFYGYRKTKEE